MTATQMYIFSGIDAQVILGDARKKSKDDEVMVHFHPRNIDYSLRGRAFKHQLIRDSVVVEEWGEVDGSSLAPIGKR
jgi:hypothetical protein